MELEYGVCESCKRCKVRKNGWILWCDKNKKGIHNFNKCRFYKPINPKK